MLGGGFVHHRLLKSAAWVLDRESETLHRVWEETGREYMIVFAGHSLRSTFVLKLNPPPDSAYYITLQDLRLHISDHLPLLRPSIASTCTGVASFTRLDCI